MSQEAWSQHAIDLPAAFRRYDEIGGVLLFRAFADVNGDESDCLADIANVLPDVDTERLRALSARRIDEEEFLGEWYDPTTGDLLRLGNYTTKDGQVLTNPRLRNLDGVDIRSGGSEIPEAGSGGQFAYAFSWTPYGLRGRPSRTQQLFDTIRGFILPPALEHEIRDWSSPRLPEVSQYFAAGMEWWGVFLFTIYVPAARQMTVIVGSTTD